MDESDELGYAYPQSWVVASTVTAVLLGGASLTAFTCIAAILASPATRRRSFNFFTIFLILPDATLTGLICYSLCCEMMHQGRFSHGLCLLRHSAAFFYYTTNLYLNAVVCYHLFQLVWKSHEGIRANPPSFRQAYMQVGVVYLGSATLGVWSMGGWPLSPYTLYDTTYCHWHMGTSSVSKLGGLWITLFLMAVPTLYVSIVYFRVWHQSLLPRSGKARAIVLYFFRIVLVYFLFYIPNSLLVISYLMVGERKQQVRVWLLWTVFTIAALQCAVTVRLVLTKDDVRDAVHTLLYRIGLCRVPATMMPFTPLCSSILSGDHSSAARTPAVVSRSFGFKSRATLRNSKREPAHTNISAQFVSYDFGGRATKTATASVDEGSLVSQSELDDHNVMRRTETFETDALSSISPETAVSPSGTDDDDLECAPTNVNDNMRAHS